MDHTLNPKKSNITGQNLKVCNMPTIDLNEHYITEQKGCDLPWIRAKNNEYQPNI